jgi:hypothetical protein
MCRSAQPGSCCRPSCRPSSPLIPTSFWRSSPRTDGFVDVLAAGCDAGIRYDERLEQDMIAVPIGPRRQRFATAASLAYLDRRGRPDHPRELLNHASCAVRSSCASVPGPTLPWMLRSPAPASFTCSKTGGLSRAPSPSRTASCLRRFHQQAPLVVLGSGGGRRRTVLGADAVGRALAVRVRPLSLRTGWPGQAAKNQSDSHHLFEFGQAILRRGKQSRPTLHCSMDRSQGT